MLDALLLIALDLTAGLGTDARHQRLIEAVRRVVPCDAATLLRLEGGVLVPVAAEGLVPEAIGHRFDPADHPRLAALLASTVPVRFPADDPRPDPYDHLLAGHAHVGVHACMGCALRVDDELVGVLTVDAADPGAFDEVDARVLATFAALAAAALRTAALIDALEESARRSGRVAQQLLSEVLGRGSEMVGRSPALLRLFGEIDRAAPADLPVLVTGETGTGKELVARALHARSGRRDRQLVYVNCAALPESVAESELFGHVRGAFTGATADRPGRFELAHGGTLFLDEVGELPASLQPKLLRALQGGEIQRVGTDRVHHVDVRVVAATNRDLPAEVAAGRFRADLFHRLGVLLIRVPSLGDRTDDIPLLAGFFLDRARVQLGLGPVRLTPAAHRALADAPWPGNIRELEHVLMRAALHASDGRRGEPVLVDAHHLDVGPAVATPTTTAPAWAPGRSLAAIVDDAQTAAIRQALAAHDDNWAAAARALGVDRSNLHRLGRRLGLR